MVTFAEKLKQSLTKALPGTNVQWEMASSDRMAREYPRVAGHDARIAAVLILLYPVNGEIHTVFMQRPHYNGAHGGQISFPGGKSEPGDSSIIATALREAEEETGVSASAISVIGTLTPLFIHVSNMLVTPVLAWTDARPSFSHHEREVMFLIEARLKSFLDNSIISTKCMNIRGTTIDVKYFDYRGNVIWGATAMILNELLTILRRDNFLL